MGQRARMIIEAYSSVTVAERERIEEEHRWTSLVIPVATLEVQEPKAADANFAKATKEDMKTLTKTVNTTNKIVKKDIDQIKDGMKGLKESNDEIKDGMKGMKGLKESNDGIK